MDSVKVTVLMPVYNGSLFIAEAIESILQQTYTCFELLIINDGSTDDSIEIAESFQDPRIRIVHNTKNLGLVPTRNRGIKEARGQYLALLDCDDIALPERLSKQVEVLDLFPEIGLVASQIYLIDTNGTKTGVSKYKQSTEEIGAELFFNNCIAQSSVLVRSSLLKQHFYREEYPPAEDYDLWVRLAAITKIKILTPPLVLYREHANNISVTKSAVQANAVTRIASNQLNDLGIIPNEKELDLHLQMCQYRTFTSKAALQDCYSWIIQLNEVNISTNRYLPEIFQKLLIQRFMTIAGNSGLGFWALTKISKFPFFTFKTLVSKDGIKFFIKCMIKWKGRRGEFI